MADPFHWTNCFCTAWKLNRVLPEGCIEKYYAVKIFRKKLLYYSSSGWKLTEMFRKNVHLHRWKTIAFLCKDSSECCGAASWEREKLPCLHPKQRRTQVLFSHWSLNALVSVQLIQEQYESNRRAIQKEVKHLLTTIKKNNLYGSSGGQDAKTGQLNQKIPSY